MVVNAVEVVCRGQPETSALLSFGFFLGAGIFLFLANGFVCGGLSIHQLFSCSPPRAQAVCAVSLPLFLLGEKETKREQLLHKLISAIQTTSEASPSVHKSTETKERIHSISTF